MGKYFGTDGIRGVANKTLTNEMVYKVGYFLGNYVKNNLNGKIVIGKDTRISSSMFEAAIASGIASSGANVYLIGYCSTPCLAYSVDRDCFDLGVMISASHNSYTDNGIKVFSKNGIKLQEDIELQIEDYLDNKISIDNSNMNEIGSINNFPEAIEHYKSWMKELYPVNLNNIKVLIDCANGSNSYIAYDVLKDLGADVSSINDKPNGTNINYGCGSTHLESLKENIKKGNYDIGFAFDGDADRLLAIDRNANEINGDCIMYVLAKYLKAINKLENNTIVVTGYSNIGLHKSLYKNEINTVVVDNGDKYVLEEMLKNNFSLGGEQTGHIIIKNDCNFGDGLKTSLCLLNALKYFDSTIEESIKELIIYPQLLVSVKVKDKKKVMEDKDFILHIKDIENKLQGNGQILVRASGTEPLIRIMIEAKTDVICKKYVNELVTLIDSKRYSV